MFTGQLRRFEERIFDHQPSVSTWAIYNQPIPIFQVTSIYLRKTFENLRANNCTKGSFFPYQCLVISQFSHVARWSNWRFSGVANDHEGNCRPLIEKTREKVDLFRETGNLHGLISGIWIIYWFGVCEFMIDGWTGFFHAWRVVM